MIVRLGCVALVLASTQVAAAEAPAARNVGDDALGTLHQAGSGTVAQVTDWGALALLAGGVAGTSALLLTEEHWQSRVERTELLGESWRKVADIGGIITSAPTVPVGAYIWGRVADDPYLTQFATELMATQGILMVETLLLSQIPIHKRPVVSRGEVSEEGQAFFNRFFRGASSLPSGHMIGVAALTFKGWEWYGWTVGAPAALATLFVGYARVEEGQHYTSDIFSAVALAGLASLGTTHTRHVWQSYLPPNLLLTPTASPNGAGLAVSGAF